MDVSLLGSRTADVLWMVDGVRINNRLYAGTTPLDTMPAGMDSRLEVLDGGQSLFYGTQAVAGAVNIVTKPYSSALNGLFSVASDTNQSYHVETNLARRRRSGPVRGVRFVRQVRRLQGLPRPGLPALINPPEPHLPGLYGGRQIRLGRHQPAAARGGLYPHRRRPRLRPALSRGQQRQRAPGRPGQRQDRLSGHRPARLLREELLPQLGQPTTTPPTTTWPAPARSTSSTTTPFGATGTTG